VQHLVRAREVYICESCVALAQQAVAEAGDQRLVRIKPRPRRPDDRDAAEAAVEDAFETVFSADAAVELRCAAIEGGTNLAETMAEVSERFTAAAGLDVAVEQVRFLSDDEAEVSFVLLFPGGPGPGAFAPIGPMGPGTARLAEVGHAVLVDGAWKVARETYCRLVQRVGVQCPPPPD
jgi:hypothetical protein